MSDNTCIKCYQKIVTKNNFTFEDNKKNYNLYTSVCSRCLYQETLKMTTYQNSRGQNESLTQEKYKYEIYERKKIPTINEKGGVVELETSETLNFTPDMIRCVKRYIQEVPNMFESRKLDIRSRVLSKRNIWENYHYCNRGDKISDIFILTKVPKPQEGIAEGGLWREKKTDNNASDTMHIPSMLDWAKYLNTILVVYYKETFCIFLPYFINNKDLQAFHNKMRIENPIIPELNHEINVDDIDNSKCYLKYQITNQIDLPIHFIRFHQTPNDRTLFHLEFPFYLWEKILDKPNAEQLVNLEIEKNIQNIWPIDDLNKFVNSIPFKNKTKLYLKIEDYDYDNIPIESEKDFHQRSQE